MMTRKYIIGWVVALPLLAYTILTTTHIVALEQRLATLEASHQRLVRFTHDFGTNLLGDVRLRGAFSHDMILRTVMLPHEQETVRVSTLSQVHQNAMPESLPGTQR
jgi:hypothetical protein